MSTIPGESSWADAGLLPPQEESVRTIGAPDLAEVEVLPSAPRPDLRDEAAESDVVDQALEVDADEDDYPEG
jgi:hypothetical protein